MFPFYKEAKIVVQVRNVPDGETITKRTGTNKYTVCRKITVYYKGNADKQEINADGSVVFITSKNNPDKFNALGAFTEVVWHTTWDIIEEMLEESRSK